MTEGTVSASAEPQALEHLIYVSSAVGEPDARALEAILNSAVAHNRANGVTGMLLFKEGSFLQVLEGSRGAVSETFGRVERDPRHQDVTLILREPIEARSFGEWQMGFRVLGDRDVPADPAFLPLLFGGFDAARLAAAPGVALDLLVEFARRR